MISRPDQAMRAIVGFNQPSVDRRRKRRIVQSHRQVLPVAPADLLPRRADDEHPLQVMVESKPSGNRLVLQEASAPATRGYVDRPRAGVVAAI